MPKLIPQLEAFAAEGREIVFCFDNDPKPKTKKNVNKAIVKTGKLFELSGCIVKVITWNHPAKGVDDLLVATEPDHFHDLHDERKPLLNFELADLLDLSPYVDLTINKRYLPEELTPPEDAQLIGLLGGKGTGKSFWISRRVDRNRERGIATLVITHRIQLAKALANRFGIDHIEEVGNSETGGIFGYALCVDSLHQKSLAKFNPSDWEGTHVIIDEAEQVFWHLLDSETCQKNRVTILDNFEELIKTAISTGGKIYLSDADLSQIALNYIEKLIGYPVKRWIVKNLYNSNKSKRKLFNYGGNDPRELIASLKKAIARGDKPLIHTSGQKHQSGWGTINLERYFNKLFSDLKILRIDAESVADPQHPAYGCMGNLNDILPQYDIVLCSPVVETGVSIDIKGHFDSVWCIAWGVQTVDAVCQSLERLRDDVPHHLWARKTGINRVGNGATKVKQLLASQNQLTKANISLLQRAGITSFDDLNFDWQKAHFETWAKRAVVVNAGMKQYRSSILEKLKIEGYSMSGRDEQLQPDSKEEIDLAKIEIDENKKAGYREYCEKVPKAEELNERELKELKEKRSKTEAERLAERKGNLKQRYGVEATPELVEKDDNGWYPKLRLYYYLTIGNQFLPNRDKRKLAALTEGTGKAFKPDISRQCLGMKVFTMKLLKIEQFFDKNAEFCKYSLADWCDRLRNPKTKAELKTIFGVNVCDSDSPIQVANKFLKLLGLRLSEKRWAGGRDDKHRIYSGCNLNPDDRDRILTQWYQRDVEQLNKEEVA